MANYPKKRSYDFRVNKINFLLFVFPGGVFEGKYVSKESMIDVFCCHIIS